MKDDIRKALKLYDKGKYTEAIRLLEPQVFRYRDNFRFYLILGMSCLRTGDTGGANTYLGRAISLRPNDTDALLGLAVLHLKRFEVTEALDYLLTISENDPSNRNAGRGLKLLKKDSSRERLSRMAENGTFDKLLPRRRRKNVPIILIVAAVIAAAGIAAYLLTERFSQQPVREPAVTELSLKRLDEITSNTPSARYILTESEIRESFDKAKSSFRDFHDNLAIREINRLLLSNASGQVKEQARTIMSYIGVPDFTSIKDSFSYTDVAAEPLLYDGTFVVWKGRISNLNIGDETITFDLLVGYETSQVLEGVVPVVLDFAVNLTQGNPVEILGRITVPTDDTILLEGISVHKLAPKGSQ